MPTVTIEHPCTLRCLRDIIVPGKMLKYCELDMIEVGPNNFLQVPRCRIHLECRLAQRGSYSLF